MLNNNATNVEKFQDNYKKLLRPGYIIPLLILSAVIVFMIMQGRNTDNLHSAYRVTLDTSVDLQFAPGNRGIASSLENEVFEEIERLEQLFSRTIEESDINLINSSAGERPARVSEEVLYVIEKALYYARLSEGYFDPTIAPLIDAWGFLGQEFRLPGQDEIDSAAVLVDFNLVQVDRNSSTVFLPEKGMSIELGGIAKGYIVDRALETLINAGIEHAFINAGGDIGLIGSKPDGEPWRIGVRHPREDSIIAVFPINNRAVVTSGDYQRFFTENGVNYHHLLDPNTGYPARKLVSVTVVADTVLEADALSTAIFIMGPEKGLPLLESLPGVEGLLITPEFDILLSSGLEDLVELDD